MNILEEIPKSSSKPSLPTKQSNENIPMSIFSKSSSKTSIDTPDVSPSQNEGSNLNAPSISFDFRTLIIIILLILFGLTYFGINVLNIIGNFVQKIVDSGFFKNVLELVGYSTGKAVNKTAEINSEVTTGGIEIAEGAVKNIGNLMIGDEAIGSSKNKSMNDIQPDTSENNIQKSLSSTKTKWCLAGEYKDKRGCIEISESDKCISGQVFPNEKMCLNPTITK